LDEQPEAKEDDLVLGEGQALRFVPAEEIPRLNQHPSATTILTAFLSSPAYAHLYPSALSKMRGQRG